jgi:type II secretory pathway pseudopilin PulG
MTVVAIIALLIGILLPAIGKVRDGAMLTRSQANIQQIGTALNAYSAEYHDHQFSYINDNFAHYGADGPSAVNGYLAQTGYPHPPVNLGYGEGVIWGYFLPPIGVVGNWVTLVPIDFATKFGAFRLINGRQLNSYLNGRFYDPIFYAPKDTQVIASVEHLFDSAEEFVNAPGGVRFSSYVLSPAAMFSPDVLGLNSSTGKYYNNPFSMQSGFRCPTMSQASYGNLKSRVIEHHWLQNRKKTCNPAFGGNGTYDGCEPYYFNASWESSPVVLFYDGHVGQIGTKDAQGDNMRMTVQSGNPNHGLWSKDTPMAGSFTMDSGGYYQDLAIDWTATSFHILTTDGIRGRDVIGR